MKPKQIYLLFLCLFFLTGYHHAFASCKHSGGKAMFQASQPKSSSGFNDIQNPEVLLQPDLLDENDEDDGFTSNRKKIPPCSYSALNSILFAVDLFDHSHNKHRLLAHNIYLPPDRYIFQRVLRV